MAEKIDRLTALKKRQEQIHAQIAALEAKAKEQNRKEDTRLKILVGAAVMADAALHPETAAFVETVLQRAITAERDRAFLKDKGWLQEPDSPSSSPAA